MSEIKLGSKVKDRITGFTGIAVHRTMWINGCARIGVQPIGTNKDGKTFDVETFDEPNLILLKAAPKKRDTSNEGGPRPMVYKQEIKN